MSSQDCPTLNSYLVPVLTRIILIFWLSSVFIYLF